MHGFDTNRLRSSLPLFADDLNCRAADPSASIHAEGDSFEQLREEVLLRAADRYGVPLPDFVRERIELELEQIARDETSALFLYGMALSQVVNHKLLPQGDGTETWFVSYLLGITAFNPMPPHYFCSACRYTEFLSGCETAADHWKKTCPICGKELAPEGFGLSNGYIVRRKRGLCLHVTLEDKKRAIEYVCGHLPEGFTFWDENREFHQLLQMADLKAMLKDDLRDLSVYRAFCTTVPNLEDCSSVIGIPLYDTPRGRRILNGIQPQSFGDLVRVTGYLTGACVWEGNAEPILRMHPDALKELPADIDSLSELLKRKGISEDDAFQITERVSAGNGLTGEQTNQLQDAGLPAWFPAYLSQIRLLQPKGVLVRIAWTAYAMMKCKLSGRNAFYCGMMQDFSETEFDKNIFPKFFSEDLPELLADFARVEFDPEKCSLEEIAVRLSEAAEERNMPTLGRGLLLIWEFLYSTERNDADALSVFRHIKKQYKITD